MNYIQDYMIIPKDALRDIINPVKSSQKIMGDIMKELNAK